MRDKRCTLRSEKGAKANGRGGDEDVWTLQGCERESKRQRERKTSGRARYLHL